jgi:hypothetical protein
MSEEKTQDNLCRSIKRSWNILAQNKLNGFRFAQKEMARYPAKLKYFTNFTVTVKYISHSIRLGYYSKSVKFLVKLVDI